MLLKKEHSAVHIILLIHRLPRTEKLRGLSTREEIRKCFSERLNVDVNTRKYTTMLMSAYVFTVGIQDLTMQTRPGHGNLTTPHVPIPTPRTTTRYIPEGEDAATLSPLLPATTRRIRHAGAQGPSLTKSTPRVSPLRTNRTFRVAIDAYQTDRYSNRHRGMASCAMISPTDVTARSESPSLGVCQGASRGCSRILQPL